MFCKEIVVNDIINRILMITNTNNQMTMQLQMNLNLKIVVLVFFQ